MTPAILICVALLVHEGDRRDIDGDTFWARCEGEAAPGKIRLADVEAAERGLPCRAGRAAQMASTVGLWRRVEGRRLRVTVTGLSHDRRVARVEALTPAGWLDVGADLQAAGAVKPWPGGRGPRPAWCGEAR